MVHVKFKNADVKLSGELPEIDSKTPIFTLVKDDLSEIHLSDFTGKKKILMVVPSLDTGVCQKQTKEFNEKLATKKDVVGIVISEDLPFAIKRFCGAEGITNVIAASDFRYRNFLSSYNLEMVDGPLKGLTARAIFVVDKDDVIRYIELVPEITQEPNYQAALEALDKI